MNGSKVKGQLWVCETGCGLKFYWLIDKPRKQRPNCPSCGRRDRMVSKDMFSLEAVEVSILGFT